MVETEPCYFPGKTIETLIFLYQLYCHTSHCLIALATFNQEHRRYSHKHQHKLFHVHETLMFIRVSYVFGSVTSILTVS